MIFIKALQKLMKQGLMFQTFRQLLNGRNRKVIGVMKDESGGKIMKKCFGLTAKTID